jgi:hypothetical protein
MGAVGRETEIDEAKEETVREDFYGSAFHYLQ